MDVARWMDEKIHFDTDALPKWQELSTWWPLPSSPWEDQFECMPNAVYSDPMVPVPLDHLLVRIDHNLRSTARQHCLPQTSSLTCTFYLELTVQEFMQVECRGSCNLRNVEGKTWHAMMAFVESLKTAQRRTLLLLQLPKLVKCRR